MQTILDENVAEQLAKGGYFYVMHRFDKAGRIPLSSVCTIKGSLLLFQSGSRITSMISLANSRLMLGIYYD